MPQVFKIGTYWVYFWANENEPLEAIHVHVSQGVAAGECHKDLDYEARRLYSLQ